MRGAAARKKKISRTREHFIFFLEEQATSEGHPTYGIMRYFLSPSIQVRVPGGGEMEIEGLTNDQVFILGMASLIVIVTVALSSSYWVTHRKGPFVR